MAIQKWRHKDLLDVTYLSDEEILFILDNAKRFQEVNLRAVKKVPTLKGKTVTLFFSEPSTRTKLSFDTAAKRLSADTFALGKSGSSVQKGESLKDTALIMCRHRRNHLCGQRFQPDRGSLSGYGVRYPQCCWHCRSCRFRALGFPVRGKKTETER